MIIYEHTNLGVPAQRMDHFKWMKVPDSSAGLWAETTSVSFFQLICVVLTKISDVFYKRTNQGSGDTR